MKRKSKTKFNKWLEEWEKAHAKEYIINKAHAMLDSFECKPEKAVLEHDPKKKEVRLTIVCRDDY